MQNVFTNFLNSNNLQAAGPKADLIDSKILFDISLKLLKNGISLRFRLPAAKLVKPWEYSLLTLNFGNLSIKGSVLSL